jgi:hypothetical protein
VFGWRDGTILFRCLIVRRVKNGIDGILKLLVVDPSCYALDQKMWALDVNTQNRGGAMVVVGYTCFTASPLLCRCLMPRPAPPSNPTCVATMGLLRRRRPPPTTLPLSALACSVLEPCSTSTTSSHGAPLIYSCRTPKVVGDGGDGREVRGETMLLRRERQSSIV